MWPVYTDSPLLIAGSQNQSNVLVFTYTKREETRTCSVRYDYYRPENTRTILLAFDLEKRHYDSIIGIPPEIITNMTESLPQIRYANEGTVDLDSSDDESESPTTSNADNQQPSIPPEPSVPPKKRGPKPPTRGFASNRIQYTNKDHADQLIQCFKDMRENRTNGGKIDLYTQAFDEYCQNYRHTRQDKQNLTSYKNLLQHFREEDQEFAKQVKFYTRGEHDSGKFFFNFSIWLCNLFF